MSVLPGGKPLVRALPDLDDLLTDPQAYLREAPLAIGPRKMYGLALLFALPGLAFVLSCVAQGKPDGERLAMGIGLLLGGCVWLGWSLMMRGHEMVLHHDGVEFTYRDRTVWAPWALFHVEGRPFVPESDSPRAGLTLPVNPRAVPHVELRNDGMPVAWGHRVDGPQWHFTGRDEVVLPARYEIAALDLGELLLVLGHRLGADLPRSSPPPEADSPLPEMASAPDPTGWITMPLTRLRLPQCCARCGGPRDDTLRVQVQARGDWLVVGFLGGARGVEVPIPVCEECKDFIVRRERNGGTIGMAVGALVGLAIGLVLAYYPGEGRDFALWLGTLAGFFLGVGVGSAIGLLLTSRPPVRFRRYSPSRGLVSVRFENPAIANRVLEGMRTRDAPP